MKMIDVLIKLANGEIKNNTVLDVIDDEGIIINEFQYDDGQFVDEYSNNLGLYYTLQADFLNLNAQLWEG